MPSGYSKLTGQNPFKGKKRPSFSITHRKNIGKCHSGTKLSDDQKKKISIAVSGTKNGFYGKHHSKETKKIIGEKSSLRKCSQVTREKMSFLRQKEKHWNWQGGKSYEPYSVDWTETLRRSIREKYNYICQLCNQGGNTIHHIDYDKKNYNPDNLINLCNSCNLKVNQHRDYWTNYFKKC